MKKARNNVGSASLTLSRKQPLYSMKNFYSYIKRIYLHVVTQDAILHNETHKMAIGKKSKECDGQSTPS